MEDEWERARLFARLSLGREGENLTVLVLELSESIKATVGDDGEVRGSGVEVGASRARAEKELASGRGEVKREGEEGETVVGAEDRGKEEGTGEGPEEAREVGGSGIWEDGCRGRRAYTVESKPCRLAS